MARLPDRPHRSAGSGDLGRSPFSPGGQSSAQIPAPKPVPPNDRICGDGEPEDDRGGVNHRPPLLPPVRAWHGCAPAGSGAPRAVAQGVHLRPTDGWAGYEGDSSRPGARPAGPCGPERPGRKRLPWVASPALPRSTAEAAARLHRFEEAMALPLVLAAALPGPHVDGGPPVRRRRRHLRRHVDRLRRGPGRPHAAAEPLSPHPPRPVRPRGRGPAPDPGSSSRPSTSRSS